MNWQSQVIGVASLMLSMVVFVYTVTKKANEDHVQSLAQRVTLLEAENGKLKDRVEELESENLRLLKRIFQG